VPVGPAALRRAVVLVVGMVLVAPGVAALKKASPHDATMPPARAVTAAAPHGR
jgi:hypothetical protein